MRHNAFYCYEPVGLVDDDPQKVGQRVHEDLLARPPIGLDPRPVEQLIAGKTIMVTGAGGSIASELCRQIAPLRPKPLLLFQRYENTLFTVANELLDKHPGVPIFPIVGDVTHRTWQRHVVLHGQVRQRARQPRQRRAALPRANQSRRAGHRHARRYFMLIPEAVQLVLHAASGGENGRLYVLEMGEQVRLVDMARDLIRLAGFAPDAEIPMTFIGLRPGEKLYEELFGDDEVAARSPVDKVMGAHPLQLPDRQRLLGNVARLEELARQGGAAGVQGAAGARLPAWSCAARRVSGPPCISTDTAPASLPGNFRGRAVPGCVFEEQT